MPVPNPDFKRVFEIHHFYVEDKANKEEVRQTNKRLLIVAERQREVPTKGENPEREGATLGGSWEKAGVKNRYELLGLPHSGCWSTDSVIQRLHSRQLKVWSSPSPIHGMVRAKLSARPQLGQAG